MGEFWEPTPEIIKQIEGWAALGMTQQQIADNLDIAPETLTRKKKDFAQLYQALKKGAFTGGTHIANALFQNATTHNNVTAQIFYLKTRLGWKDNDNEEVKQIVNNGIQEMRNLVHECKTEKS